MRSVSVVEGCVFAYFAETILPVFELRWMVRVVDFLVGIVIALLREFRTQDSGLRSQNSESKQTLVRTSASTARLSMTRGTDWKAGLLSGWSNCGQTGKSVLVSG